MSSKELVSRLPRPLLTFFAKFPPASAESWAGPAGAAKNTGQQIASKSLGVRRNPFIPSKNMKTFKYQEPTYSIRNQTNLVNLAAKYNLSHLLPPRVPHKEKEGEKKVMRGMIKWKGTKSERTKEARMGAVQTKLKEAKIKLQAKRSRSRIKRADARTGLDPNK